MAPKAREPGAAETVGIGADGVCAETTAAAAKMTNEVFMLAGKSVVLRIRLKSLGVLSGIAKGVMMVKDCSMVGETAGF